MVSRTFSAPGARPVVIPFRWDVTRPGRLGRLLARLRLPLLHLLGLLARQHAAGRFPAQRRVGSKSRQRDRDDQFPLHAAHVTTRRLNAK